ncbi:hypothetical protein T484DRAFT_1980034 [Baffinella frigidus]|nr:hypothetical protein T484DRAFT_1980034 [Cryptophyta sp. CCMP2293]
MARHLSLGACAVALLVCALSPADACWPSAPSNLFGVRGGELAQAVFATALPSSVQCNVAEQPCALIDEALGSFVRNVAGAVKPPHVSSGEWLRASSLFLRPSTEIADCEMGLCGANLGELSGELPLRKNSA